MSFCADCGTKLSGETCPNCQEELYIFENQYHEDPWELSEDFKNKIQAQKRIKESGATVGQQAAL